MPLTIIKANTKKLKKEYLQFMRQIYKGNKNYKDINIFFAKNFLFQEDLFSKKCKIYPALIKENNIIVACATCIMYELASELFLSFFEALENKGEAVDLIIKKTKEIAQKEGKHKIVIGINGHISYSVGILENNYDIAQTFDSSYNPPYYIEYFEKYCSDKKEAVSYGYDLNKIKFDDDVLKRIHSEISFRFLDKKNFKKDILMFGDLCDQSMKGTPYYYQKTKEEMYDSLKSMRHIFNEENIIFAIKDGKEIGFILHHPDYNQAIMGQHLTPLKLFLGSKFGSKKIDTMIINIIGILPDYRIKAIIIGLLNEAHKIADKHKYKNIYSTFVFKDNLESTKLCSSLSSREVNKYYIYEINI